MAKRKTKMLKSDIVYMTIVYTYLGLFILAVAYPLLYVLSCSFSSPTALIAGKVFLFPVDFSLLGYSVVFKSVQIWIGYKNTLVYTVVYTVLCVFVTMLAAFPLTRKEFPAKTVVTWMFTVTMFISSGLIPSYLLVKYLGIMNTMWALIVPGLVSAWSVIIARTFMKSSIPEEMFEACSIDGSSYFQYFFKMVLPLSKPIIAVLALNFATGMWNSYFSALLYITDANKYPLQIILRNILVQNVVDFATMNKLSNIKDMMQRQYLGELLKYSLIVVSSVPLLIFYPFIQKYFMKGVMVGSIKG